MRSHSVFQKRLWGIAVLAAVITAILAALIRSQPVAQPPVAETPPTGEHEVASTTAPTPYAYVGEWEGRLAVFRTKSTAPEEVYDVFLASLPPAEQQALADGIPVYDEVELQGLLEDYTS